MFRTDLFFTVITHFNLSRWRLSYKNKHPRFKWSHQSAAYWESVNA